MHYLVITNGNVNLSDPADPAMTHGVVNGDNGHHWSQYNSL